MDRLRGVRPFRRRKEKTVGAECSVRAVTSPPLPIALQAIASHGLRREHAGVGARAHEVVAELQSRFDLWLQSTRQPEEAESDNFRQLCECARCDGFCDRDEA